MQTRIAIDLDNTIFNLAEKYRATIEKLNCRYTPPVSYDVYQNSYPEPVADALYDMLHSDAIYSTSLFDGQIPAALNTIYNDPKYMLFYITERPDGDDWGQLKNAGIICDKTRVVNCTPKINALKKHNIDLCFDDSPSVVASCLDNNIDIVMISNEDTAYNHHLRGRTEYYPTLMMALKKRGVIK
ncbi:MAG: hypothetical protein J5742_03670 [Alphaproteobacteria bacterium]|nr:hypothetical protein [Alphaproteobacteria bacterium]